MSTTQQLKAYLDNELSAAERAAVEQQLTTSPELQEELIALQSLTAEFGTLRSTPEPAGKEDLMRSLRVAAAEKPKATPIWKPLLATGGGVLGLAILASMMPRGGALAPGRAAFNTQSESAVASSPAPSARPAPGGADLRTTEAGSAGMAAPSEEAKTKSAPGMGTDGTTMMEDGPRTRNEILNGVRDVIYNGSLTVEVADAVEAKRQLIGLVTSINGIVSSSSTIRSRTGLTTMQYSLRVPAAKFEQTVQTLSELGTVRNQQSTAEDVTADIAAGEGRARALANAEQTTIAMLAKASNTSERLAIHRRLDEIRAEREAIKEQTERFKSLSAMSMLDVTLVTQTEGATGAWWNDSWSGASTTLGRIGEVLGRAGIYTLTFAPLWIPLGLGVWWWRRRRAF